METNPALELARKAQAEALQKAQAAAEEKAREEQSMEAKIQSGVDQLFRENVDNPQWWRSGDPHLWFQDVCATLSERVPELNIKSDRLCLWISGNESIETYISETYKAAHEILDAVDDIPADDLLQEPKDLVGAIRKQLSLDDDFKYLLKPLVLAQRQARLNAVTSSSSSSSSSRRTSSRLRQQDPAKVAARKRQLGVLTSTLVDLLVNWNQKFKSAKDLYAALVVRGVTKPEDIADFEFVEHAYEVFQVMQNKLTAAATTGVIPTVKSLRAVLDASEPLMKLKTQDDRMQSVIQALSQPMIPKYIRNAKIRKWAIPGAIGGAVALFSILGSLRWLRPQKQNSRSRQ